jgi:uncharacterized membrane protein
MDIPTSRRDASATPVVGRPEALSGAERLEHLRFPTFKHAHPAILNINQAHEEHQTLGNRIADQVVATVGSWRFIILQSIILLAWIVLNSVAWAYAWDPRPFILLNLALSFEAAYSAPFVMISQNRQAAKDRLTAEQDYHMDIKGEEEIRYILEHLDHQDALILGLMEQLEHQHEAILRQIGAAHPALGQNE